MPRKAISPPALDWRYRTVTTLSEDWKSPFTSIVHKKGSPVSLSTFVKHGDTVLQIGDPSGPALFLSHAEESHAHALRLHPFRGGRRTQPGKDPSRRAYDYLQAIMASIVFSFTAIEAFAMTAMAQPMDLSLPRAPSRITRSYPSADPPSSDELVCHAQLTRREKVPRRHTRASHRIETGLSGSRAGLPALRQEMTAQGGNHRSSRRRLDGPGTAAWASSPRQGPTLSRFAGEWLGHEAAASASGLISYAGRGVVALMALGVAFGLSHVALDVLRSPRRRGGGRR